jgi:PST family polysaccharide transporter
VSDPSSSDRRSLLRRKAARGLVTVAMRSVIVRALALASTIVVAPLLGPSNYGVIAIGTTILVVSKFLADGGLNPGFIGREEPPTLAELRALVAFQLLVTTVIAAGVAAVALSHGERGLAITLMVAAPILDSFRVPNVIMAEREIEYGLIVRAEIIEVVVYAALSIGLVAGGMGVVGVGVATLARAVVGGSIMIARGDLGLVLPRWDFARLRPTARFGVFFQGAWLATIMRDEGLNVLLAVLSGTAALGAWALAQRMMVVLTTLFQSAWRVALPGLARLMEAGEPPRMLLERGLSFAAAASGFPVAALVAITPAAVPWLFGDGWEETVTALPWVAAGQMIGVPLGTVLGSLLWARGEAQKVFRMAVPALAVTLGLGAALMSGLGAEGAAIAFFVGQLVFFAACMYYARDLFGRAAAERVAVPTFAAAVAAASGWVVAVVLAPGWLATAAAAVCALLLYSALLTLLDRAAMYRVLGVLRQSVRPLTTA